jgi:hypothetical protein
VSALFCILLQAAVIAHVDFAAHGVCLEHGELTDLVSQPKVVGASAVMDPHPDGVAGLHVPASTLTSPDEHCLLSELIRQLDAGHARVLPRPISRVQREPRALAVQPVTRPGWLLRLAPKQSPPV